MFEPDNFMSYVYIYIYGVDVCIGLLYVGVECAHTVYTELNLVSGAKLNLFGNYTNYACNTHVVATIMCQMHEHTHMGCIYAHMHGICVCW